MAELRVQHEDEPPVAGRSPAGLRRRIGTRPAPVFAILALTSGALEGAVLRDLHLARALHRRGFKVFVYWMMERLPWRLDRGIRQRVLLRGLRYYPARRSPILEGASRVLDLVGHRLRRRFVFRRPSLIARLLRNYLAEACREQPDPGLARRLERLLRADGITHLLPTHAMTCPLARAVKEGGRHAFDYLVTFQGEEIFANYLRDGPQLEAYRRQLRRAVAASPWPAVAVSNDYARRMQAEIGLEPAELVAIYPGVELPRAAGGPPSTAALAAALPWLKPGLPIVAYFGRQDAEKGIDLLLYAARLLKERGVKHQLAIAGSAAFGKGYEDVCRSIARHLRLEVSWTRQVSDELRSALYRASRCVVYPSIHREPFGMVATEAMAHGTPVIVPDHGGVGETIRIGGRAGGLAFRAWDSRDLADQLERLLTDDALHAALAAAGPGLAARFSIDAMTDRLLAHMGLPMRA